MIDLHCDTILKIFENNNSNLYSNNYCIDIKKLVKNNSFLQCFALYTEDIYMKNDIELIKKKQNDINKMIELYNKEILLNNKYIQKALSYNDILKNMKDNKITSILAIEGIGMINNIDLVYDYYKKGVRIMTLTWNYPNTVGYPNSHINYYMSKGLTDFGIKLVKFLDEKGIVIDVSHLSDAGFFDVLKHTKNPFIASHSNARAIENHPRNLTDEMIVEISKRGGVIGINLCPQFLNSNSKESTITDIINHINHIKKIGGINCISLGTDFDGINGDLALLDISQMNQLKKALKLVGYTTLEIDKIWYKNALRVFKKVLK